jgi:hypothetical protein
MLNSSIVTILKKISPSMTHVDQMGTTSGLNSQNQKRGRKFQTLYGRIRATLNEKGFDDNVRTVVWAECARTTTLHSNFTSIMAKDNFPYQLLFGSKPKLPKNLKIFGEMDVVTSKDDIQGKLENHGLACMFV